MNEIAPWLILFLPLLSAAVIALFTQKARGLSAAISISAIVIAFVLSVILFVNLAGHSAKTELALNWLTVGNLQDRFRHSPRRAQSLDAAHRHRRRQRDSYLFLGLHARRPLRLALFRQLEPVHVFDARNRARNNFFQMFIFWELVGVSSYLLIGFWYESASAADAAKKAFITNRLGDFGFLLGIIIVWATARQFEFQRRARRARDKIPRHSAHSPRRPDF